MLIADGYDEALVGVTTDGLAVYDNYKIISILMERDGMDEDEAIEFFDFNIAGSYMGEETPIFMYFDDNVLEFENVG